MVNAPPAAQRHNLHGDARPAGELDEVAQLGTHHAGAAGSAPQRAHASICPAGAPGWPSRTTVRA